MSTNASSKVVSLKDFKKLKNLEKEEKQFQTYLKSLKQDQLQIEADFLMKEVEENGASDKRLHQIALLMEELASRVEGAKMTSDINEFASNIRDKFTLEVNNDLVH